MINNITNPIKQVLDKMKLVSKQCKLISLQNYDVWLIPKVSNLIKQVFVQIE